VERRLVEFVRRGDPALTAAAAPGHAAAPVATAPPAAEDRRP
jgi:hypothetical protein